MLALPSNHEPLALAAVATLFFLPPALVQAWWKHRRRREDEQLLPVSKSGQLLLSGKSAGAGGATGT